MGWICGSGIRYDVGIAQPLLHTVAFFVDKDYDASDGPIHFVRPVTWFVGFESPLLSVWPCFGGPISFFPTRCLPSRQRRL